MTTDFFGISRLFEENVAAVERLLELDAVIIDVAVGALKALEEKFEADTARAGVLRRGWSGRRTGGHRE